LDQPRREFHVWSQCNQADDNYQVNQAKIAVANGGWIGLGPGNSRQRNFLPHPYSDFIYAIIIEEYGLIGGAIIMFIYLVFCLEAYAYLKNVPSPSVLFWLSG